MYQVLQSAGLALQACQDLVGLPHLPHVIPGRAEHLNAVPDHRDEHHDDRRVQRRDRQDAPADRHRADQPNEVRMAARGEAQSRVGRLLVLVSSYGQSVHLANSFDQRRGRRIALRLCVDRQNRLFEGLAVEVGHDRHARAFRLPARLRLKILPPLAHEAARLKGGLAKNLVVLRRQALPGLARHHQHFRAHGVFGESIEVRIFVVIGCDKGGPVVLRAVDQLGGKSGENLPIGQFDRFGAERLDHVGHQFGLLDANSQALHVRNRADRFYAVVDRPRAGIVEGEADETEGLEAVKDLLSDRAIQYLLQMFDGAEQKWHSQYIHCGHEGSDQRYVGAIEIDGAGAGLFDRFLFLAELARMKYADLQAAAGFFLDQAAHVAQRLYGWIILALGIGGAKFPRQSVRRDGRQNQPNDGCCLRKVGAAIHRQLPPSDEVDGRNERFNDLWKLFAAENPRERSRISAARCADAFSSILLPPVGWMKGREGRQNTAYLFGNFNAFVCVAFPTAHPKSAAAGVYFCSYIIGLSVE